MTAPTISATSTTENGVQPTVHAPTDIPSPTVKNVDPFKTTPVDTTVPTAEPRDYEPGTVGPLGKNELSACKWNPYDCKRSFSAGDKEMAESESIKYFPLDRYSSGDSQQDAARHCIWQGLMTESSNADFAEKMANAHEIDKPSGEAAGTMDMYNNVTGRAIGLRNEGNRAAIISQCVDAARKAQFWDPKKGPAPAPNGEGLIYIRRPNS
ncbi:hypothetical protein WKY82_08330 [Gordonia malaquae]|uniref:DUF6973 domain-containing protein n=1 Tax=Gordonia malaquae TaxID=410332 RepID=UPI0030C78A6E